MKNNVYIYPISNRLKTGLYNPYLDNFISCTENKFFFVNQKDPSNTGIFNLLKYIHRIDFLALNWIENLPDKKGGVIQSIFFLFILRVKKIFGFKVIWTLHNKISHSRENKYFKKKLFNSLLKRSDLIITHAKEGIRFAENLLPGVLNRIFYFPHPVEVITPNKEQVDKEYDILIWGTIAPYKGIDKFLEYLKKKNALNSFRILIAGKAVSHEYFQKIKIYESIFINIRNQFISQSELSQLIAKSKIVLFTYTVESVLSSGALIDSVVNKALVMGPSVGAFKELKEWGIITTYSDHEDLLRKLQSGSINMDNNRKKSINDFIEHHTWRKFGKALITRLLKV